MDITGLQLFQAPLLPHPQPWTRKWKNITSNKNSLESKARQSGNHPSLVQSSLIDTSISFNTMHQAILSPQLTSAVSHSRAVVVGGVLCDAGILPVAGWVSGSAAPDVANWFLSVWSSRYSSDRAHQSPWVEGLGRTLRPHPSEATGQSMNCLPLNHQIQWCQTKERDGGFSSYSETSQKGAG